MEELYHTHEKKCTVCKQMLSLDNFSKNGKYSISKCRECTRAADRERNKIRNPRKTTPKPLPTQENHKVCNTCLKEKPYEDFKKTALFKDGRAGRCKACDADIRKNRTEEEIEKERQIDRDYFERNKDEIRRRGRERSKTEHHKEVRNKRQREKYALEAEIRRREKENPPPLTEKKCPKCEQVKVLEEFALRKDSKDKRTTYCKKCNRDYHNSANIKRRKNENTRKRLLDPTYKAIHHRKINEWRKKNPLGQRELTLRRNARKKAQRTERLSYKRILKRDGMFCHICQKNIIEGEKFEFDHVIPLVKGGSHSEANIKIAHMVCNRRKGSKILD